MSYNKPTENTLTIFRCSSNEYSIQLSFTKEFFEDLNLEHGQVPTEEFIAQWLHVLSQAKSQQMSNKIDKYSLHQLIFDSSIAVDPNKKKEEEKKKREQASMNKAKKTKAKKRISKLDAFKKDITAWVKSGLSKAEVARRVHCHVNTLRNYIKESLPELQHQM